jgi:hypothetical protein
MRRLKWRALGASVLMGALALALGTDSGSRNRALAQTAPTPPALTPSPLPQASLAPQPPTPSPTPAPRRARRGASASPTPGQTSSAEPTATPTSPAYSTLDGSWEVQLQRIDTTLYSRFTVKQDGNTVSGTWYVEGKEVPFDGTYDGRLFHFVAKDPKGNLDLSGYVENATNMVGIVDNGKGDVPYANPLPFTAEHRGGKASYPKKEKKKG